MKNAYTLYSSNVQGLGVVREYDEFYLAECRGGLWDFGDPTSKKERWTPIEFYIQNPLAPKPDIWLFSSNILILEERAIDVLYPIIQEYGELYDQPVDGRAAAAFHVQRVVEPSSEDWERDSVFEYDLNSISDSIFIASRCLTVVTGATEPNLDFKKIVEMNSLIGLSFSDNIPLSKYYDSSVRND